jgi:hypothetical protein
MKKGYVTTLNSILGKTDYQLEQLLGFSRGRLEPGYKVFSLSDTVYSRDFIWRDKTRYSAGWHGDPSIQFGSDPNVVWGVQRWDELRASLGRKLNYDERAVDSEIAKIMERSLEELNVRTGDRRIVKVVPLQKEPDGYPDAESGNIPQWELIVPMHFTFIGEFHGPFRLPKQSSR